MVKNWDQAVSLASFEGNKSIPELVVPIFLSWVKYRNMFTYPYYNLIHNWTYILATYPFSSYLDFLEPYRAEKVDINYISC